MKGGTFILIDLNYSANYKKDIAGLVLWGRKPKISADFGDLLVAKPSFFVT